MFLILNICLKNMLYSIYFSFWHYICSGKRENKFLKPTSSLYPNQREHNNLIMTEMKRTNDTIEKLKYQLKRYKAMKKGAACQSLQIKLHKLMNQANG